MTHRPASVNDGWIVGGDQLVVVRNLRANTPSMESETVNDAEIEATFQDAITGEEIGEPITLEHVDGSDGLYSGIKPHDMPMIVGRRYTAKIVAKQGGQEWPWHLTMQAKQGGPLS